MAGKTKLDLSVVCSPENYEPLKLLAEKDSQGVIRETLVGARTGKKYPLCDGIADFIEEKKISGSNSKYRKLYDGFAPFYDFVQKLAYLFFGGERRVRTQFLNELGVNAGDKVLEVSIGTGANIRYLPRNAHYYGLDISKGMLLQCRKNLENEGIGAFLAQGEAEKLPFNDNSFDAVFHVGGINFFNDKSRAMLEMLRVAKPGARIMVADEVEEIAQDGEKIPVIGAFYRNRKERICAPINLIPHSATGLEAKHFFGGKIYCLLFRKPGLKTGKKHAPHGTA